MFPFPFGFIGSGEVIPDLELISNDYAMEFDGTSTYISAGNPSELQITGTLTVSAWFKILNNSGNRVIVARDAAASQRNWSLYIQGGTGYVNLLLRNNTDTGWNQVSSSSAYDDGNWHHVAFAYTPSTSLILYVDGVAVDTNTTSITPSINNETADFTIGAYSSNQGYTGDRWDGDIDEVAIWNKALELADVQTIYNSTNNNPGKCANLFTGGLGSGLVYWNRMGD